MADAVQYVKHIEVYVDSSTSPSQQAASVDAIASLLKKDFLSLEALVREMDLYLTTTDSIIRSRGILLLGELLRQLELKPLSSAAIHSLMGFFTERLGDWKALRGALVGCLALMSRTNGVGTASDTEAEAVARTFMENLQVQSLGQHDRKLCFELLECLLERYPTAVFSLGDELFYMICEAIDGERDPQCLLLAFHVVELAAKLFPNPSASLVNNAEELFDLMGRFFPIHFTHPNGEDDTVDRADLSQALQLAFASSPFFEPFAIPLLLSKLSSSLPLAKVESLKYLRCCAMKYGSERMAKHAESLWSALKDLLYWSPEFDLCPESESAGSMVFKENDVLIQAFLLLQELTRDCDFLLKLILNDTDLTAFINSLTQSKDLDYMTVQRKQLHAVSRLLSVSAKSSDSSCNEVFQRFFPLLMETLSISSGNPCEYMYDEGDGVPSAVLHFPCLYLCVELLGACRELVVDVEDPSSTSDHVNEIWCSMVHDFSQSLARTFLSCFNTVIGESTQNIYVQVAVKGLKILATFPGNFYPMSKSLYEDILLKLVSLLTSDFDRTLLWQMVLKAIVEIGLYVNTHDHSEKAVSFETNVVETVLSSLSSDYCGVHAHFKLQSCMDIGMTGTRNMLRVVKGLNEALSVNFSGAYIDGNASAVDMMTRLLDCYSKRVLPWFEKNGGSEEVSLDFALTMLDKIENLMSVDLTVQNDVLTDATMIAVRQAVGGCSAESQSMILKRAFRLLPSSTFSKSEDSKSSTIQTKSEGSSETKNNLKLASNDELIFSFLAAVVISLRPETPIPDINTITQLLIVYLLRGHVLSAQALGSLVNKLPTHKSAADFSVSGYLEEAVDIIVNSSMWDLGKVDGKEKSAIRDDDCDMDLCSLNLSVKSNIHMQIASLSGLAWIGKGLVMRGHEKVKDITMTFLSFLLGDVNGKGSLGLCDPSEGSEEVVISLLKSAADGFHVFMSDSETCLNRQFHAVIRPLYKQRYYSSIIPVLSSSLMKSQSSVNRVMLARSVAHVVSETPLPAILDDAKMLIPLLLECLAALSKDDFNKDVIYNVILVMSGILMDKSRQEAVLESAHAILENLTLLSSYPHMFVVRETAIQCLVAMSELPHTRIYPFRTQVLRAISKALDDPKRAVRQEAVKCKQAWASIASRSLHF